MKGGSITGNTAYPYNYDYNKANGGGVYCRGSLELSMLPNRGCVSSILLYYLLRQSQLQNLRYRSRKCFLHQMKIRLDQQLPKSDLA